MGASIIRSVPKEFYITLDLKNSVSNTDFEVVEGDTENHVLITLCDDGEPVDLSDMTVVAVFTHSKGSYTQSSSGASGGITINDNVIDVHLKTRSFAVGMVECELQIHGDSCTISTTPTFNFSCRASLLSDETVASQNDIGLFSSVISQLNNQLTSLASISETYAQIPFIDVVYSNLNPSSANFTYSKQLGEYMGIFCSTSGRPQGAADYTWVHLSEPPHVQSAQVDSSGNLVLTLSDTSTISVTGFSSSLSSKITSAVSEYAPIKAQNVTVQPSAFVTSNALRDYGYAAAVSCPGMSSTYTGSVVFSAEDAQSGNFAPVATAGQDCVYIYAKQIPQSAITIPVVKGDK